MEEEVTPWDGTAEEEVEEGEMATTGGKDVEESKVEEGGLTIEELVLVVVMVVNGVLVTVDTVTLVPPTPVLFDCLFASSTIEVANGAFSFWTADMAVRSSGYVPCLYFPLTHLWRTS